MDLLTGLRLRLTRNCLFNKKWKHEEIPSINFINIIRTNFSYETSFQQHFSSYMYVKKRHSYEKFVRKMLMKSRLSAF